MIKNLWVKQVKSQFHHGLMQYQSKPCKALTNVNQQLLLKKSTDQAVKYFARQPYRKRGCCR